MDLNTAWYFLIGVLFSGYAVLDGFDLGVGVLSLFSRDEKERSIFMNAIAPVWDGNEVWLLAGGGALFAAFPVVYAAIFSGFYLALMLVLCALILRAVSLEFRAQVVSPTAQKIWGWVFGVSSLLVTILLGVAFGNILRGVPISESGDYLGTFFGLLNPPALLTGVLALVFFTAHGAAYLALKTDGDLQQRMFRQVGRLVICSALAFGVVLAALAWVSPHLFSGRLVYLTVLIPLAGFVFAWRGAVANKGLAAFSGSALFIIGLIVVAASGLYPVIAPSSIDPGFSLTAYNACSTPRTLGAMLWIALMGMPIVLVYTAVVYWAFRGKASAESYHH